MAININNEHISNNGANLDYGYGPYEGNNVSAALTLAELALRYSKVAGKTVGIKVNGVVTEYWYQPNQSNVLELVEKQTASVEVDSELSSTSENPVLNKVVKSALDGKAPSSNIQKTALASDVRNSLGKADNAIPMTTGTDGQILEKNSNETSGVKWVPKPQDGKSAYILWCEENGLDPDDPDTPSVNDWLSSLKANIGTFKFVANVPAVEAAFEDATTGGIGTAYTSDIDGIRADASTVSLILLMNTAIASPAKTYMIATQEAATAGVYEFVYAGDLQSAMPSNVVTTDKIDNSFAGGSDKVAGAEEVKILKEISATINDLDNDDESIQFIDDNGNILAKINEDGIKTKNFDSAEINPSQFLTKTEYNEKNVVESPTIGTEDSEEVVIIDSNYNILARINKDGIKTKNFDSASFSPNYRGEVTLQNCDYITILGSSMGETNVFPVNKHWSGVMSMFSDYPIQNLSLSGSNIVDTLYKIRNGNWEIKGRFVVINNNENIGNLNPTGYYEALANICCVLQSMGKIPIICSNYAKKQYFDVAMERYAYEHNLNFWDGASYCGSLLSGINPAFDDGAHLRRRNSDLYAYAYLNHMHLMARPYTSIKVFRLRDSLTSLMSGADDKLVYYGNSERAKLFKEIKITSTPSQSGDEYSALYNKQSINFDKYGLVECVLPANSSDLKSVSLKLNTNNTNVKVYAKNTFLQPYPELTASLYRTRFSISDNTISVPSIGDVYTFNNQDFTVKRIEFGENDYYCTIYCLPNVTNSSNTGTLTIKTRVEGSSGSDYIPFVLTESVVDALPYIASDNKAHWYELNNVNGEFVIPSNMIKGTIEDDKVSFLIVGVNSTFNIKDIGITYEASKLKKEDISRQFVWKENSYLRTQELLDESTFGNVGDTTQVWKDSDGDGITTIADYGGYYPADAHSIIKVTDSLSLNTIVDKTTKLDKYGDLTLELYCRYFPPYNGTEPYSQSQDTAINDDSYDFNTLFVSLGVSSDINDYRWFTYTEEIGVMWKIVRIPICRYHLVDRNNNTDNNLYIKISSNNKGIEICKISLKYNN